MNIKSLKSQFTIRFITIRSKLDSLRHIETLLLAAGIFSKNLGKLGLVISTVDLALEFFINQSNLHAYITKQFKEESCSALSSELEIILNSYLKFEFLGHWKASKIDNIYYYWNIDSYGDVAIYTDDISPLKKIIKERLLKNKFSLRITKDSSGIRSDKFKIDDIENDFIIEPTHQLLSLISRLEKFNYKRSILLYGEPGTGKSTAAKYIASQNNKIFLVISVSLSIEGILEVIEWLSPDGIIFDDLDRFINLNDFLLGLEEIRKLCPLVIATINKYKSIDKALVRPGRFDEHYHIDKLDESFVNKLLGEYKNLIPIEIYDDIKLWPVAYITDLVTRISKVGIENIQKEFEDLKDILKHQRDNYE